VGTCESLFGERAGGWVPDGLVVPAREYKICHGKAGPYAAADHQILPMFAKVL